MKALSNILEPVRSMASLSVLPTRRMRPFNQFQLKTRQLTLLVHLDEERNVARAASASGLTQPAASKLLRQIESDLNVKLFNRNTRGLAPTCYGEILVRHARRALSELGLARTEILALKSGLSGKASIGTILTPGTNLVPMAIARMKQRDPDILACIEIGDSRALVQRLARGEFDMVVGRVLDSTLAAVLVYEQLAPDEPHAVIAGASHPLGRCQEPQLEQLIDLPWILPPAGSLVHVRLAAMLSQRGLSMPSNIVESECTSAITALLQHSDMLAVLPEEAVQSYCRAGILRPLVRNLPLGVGAFGLITRPHHKLSPAAELMANAVREQAAQLYAVASRGAAGINMSVV